MKILPIEHPDREERAFLNALFASFVVTTVFGAFCPHLREFMNVSALKEFQNVSALKEFQRQHMIWLMNLNTSSENLPYFSNAATHYLFEITMIKMAEKVAEVVQSQDATIEAIAGLVEAKDMLTGKHVQRTKAYLRVLVDEMLRRGIYADVLTPEFADLVVRTAPLHDIGKIGVKDCILNKPGSHDEFERQVMKKHAAMGGKALEKAAEKTGSTEFLECAQQIAYYHHEWWNGSEKGYPGKFKGEDIPLCARLMAFADTYDAARFKRQYKPAKPHVDVVAEIDRDTGKQFDPAITPAFLAVARQFEEIAREFADDA